MAPLGKYTKAVRSGAPVAVVAAMRGDPVAVLASFRPRGRSDSIAGSAIAMPTLRKNPRREKSRCGCNRFDSVEFVGFIVTRLWWLGLTVGQWLPDVSFALGPIPALPSRVQRIARPLYPFFQQFHRLRPYHKTPCRGPEHTLAACWPKYDKNSILWFVTRASFKFPRTGKSLARDQFSCRIDRLLSLHRAK